MVREWRRRGGSQPGKEKLEYIGSTPFSQTGQSVYYYVLLDVSNSMPAAYFNAIKQSIVNFETTLKPNDRMALYTFGEQVELKLPEEHTPADTQQAMETIHNVDNRTLLLKLSVWRRTGPSRCRRMYVKERFW